MCIFWMPVNLCVKLTAFERSAETIKSHTLGATGSWSNLRPVGKQESQVQLRRNNDFRTNCASSLRNSERKRT